MNFIFEQIRTGGDRNFGYLIGDREARVAALVDPSNDPKSLVRRAEVQGLTVEYIINMGQYILGNIFGKFLLSLFLPCPVHN